MVSFVRRTGGVMLLAVTLGLALVVIGPAPARAVEVNRPAPDFRLPSTTGGEISLGDFRGKKSFSQQTFAQSLKLPFPLLSDFPNRKVIRNYGVLNERSMTAHRSFFIFDPQGIVRKKWIVPDDATTITPSDPLLREIEEIVAKR